ncbi:hypothetical protein BDQ17DRAFT_1538482 [Cyathus striatus]|nr:hypothetical protein BDQ17DRAFT_1538482 [Cyathus striatus]
MASFEAPMLLTRICSSWRRLAHSISLLWSAIHIVLPPVQEEYFSLLNISQEEPVINKLREREIGVIEWLNRSGQRPLSISIYQSMRSSSQKDNALWKRIISAFISFLLATVHPHARRWLEMDVCIHPKILEAFTKGLTRGSLPMLRSIHIDCHEFGGQRVIPSERPLDVLLRLVSGDIKSVSLTGSEFKQADLTRLQSIPWKQVTSLCLEGNIDYASNPMPREVTSIGIVLSVVRQCQLLQTLKINARSYDGGRAQGFQRKFDVITLPKLTSLCLLMDSSTYTSKLVGSLKLPSLKTLECHMNSHISTFDQDTTTFCNTLKQLLRHVVNLESLGMHSVCFNSHADFVEILRMTPHLRRLNFSWKHIPFYRWRNEPVANHKVLPQQIEILNDDLLELLSPLGKKQSEIVCPELQIFECYDGMQTSFTKKGVKEFVRARKDSTQSHRVSTLQNARVSVVAPLPCESLKDFGYWELSMGSGRFMPNEGLQCSRHAGRPYRFWGYDIINL